LSALSEKFIVSPPTKGEKLQILRYDTKINSRDCIDRQIQIQDQKNKHDSITFPDAASKALTISRTDVPFPVPRL